MVSLCLLCALARQTSFPPSSMFGCLGFRDLEISGETLPVWAFFPGFFFDDGIFCVVCEDACIPRVWCVSLMPARDGSNAAMRALFLAKEAWFPDSFT